MQNLLLVTSFDADTNILLYEFQKAFARFNPDKKDKWLSVLEDIKKELNDDDLGKQFYERLISVSPYKLIDFDNPKNNDFYVTDEIKEKGYVLSAGQYFDIKIEYVDISEEEFNAQMKVDTEELTAMFKESHDLKSEIEKQLAGLKKTKYFLRNMMK